MTREETIEYWEGLRKTFFSQLEKEENHFGRMHLQTTIDVLDTTISALRAQQEQESKPLNEWISVKDRLPDNKEHDWVLAQVVEDNGYMHIPRVMEYRQAKDDWFEDTYGWLSEYNGTFTVTHWMPLPEPPET